MGHAKPQVRAHIVDEQVYLQAYKSIDLTMLCRESGEVKFTAYSFSHGSGLIASVDAIHKIGNSTEHLIVSTFL